MNHHITSAFTDELLKISRGDEIEKSAGLLSKILRTNPISRLETSPALEAALGATRIIRAVQADPVLGAVAIPLAAISALQVAAKRKIYPRALMGRIMRGGKGLWESEKAMIREIGMEDKLKGALIGATGGVTAGAAGGAIAASKLKKESSVANAHRLSRYMTHPMSISPVSFPAVNILRRFFEQRGLIGRIRLGGKLMKEERKLIKFVKDRARREGIAQGAAGGALAGAGVGAAASSAMAD